MSPVIMWGTVRSEVQAIMIELMMLGKGWEERNRLSTLAQRIGTAAKKQPNFKLGCLPDLNFQLGEEAMAAYVELRTAFPRCM